jgi:hypothetical protein
MQADRKMDGQTGMASPVQLLLLETTFYTIQIKNLEMSPNAGILVADKTVTRY